MLPPPLPSIIYVGAFSAARRWLGVAAAGIVLAGYIISRGTLYGLSGVGLAFGTARLTHNPPLGMLLAFTVVPAIFILALVSILASIFGAVRQKPSVVLAQITCLLFGALAALCLAGLIAAGVLQGLPGTIGVDARPYYFLWPPLFAALSICYGVLATKFRSA